MSYNTFQDIKSFKDWKDLKEEGRAWTTVSFSLGFVIVFLIFNVIVNVVTMLMNEVRLNISQYFIVFLIIPLALGTIYACTTAHFIWKLNTLLYDLKEKKIELYKKSYFSSYIIGISTIFLSVNIIFNSINLFKMSLYELLQMGMWSVLGGVIIGYIYGKRNWSKFHECIREKLDNEIT
jgi:cytochrome c biogenesis protein CcdA